MRILNKSVKSKFTHFLFYSMVFISCIFILILIEIILRITGTDEIPPPSLPENWQQGYRFVPSKDEKNYFILEKDKFGKSIVKTKRKLVDSRIMHDLKFDLISDPLKKRIFCFGGSTTLGVPFESQPDLTFPGRLQVYLKQAGFNTEVINVGGASYGSDQVLEIMKEATKFNPSAFIIYCGNNEFFNYNLELIRLNESWYNLKISLSGIRIFKLIQKLLVSPENYISGGNPEEKIRKQREKVALLIETSFENQPDNSYPILLESGIFRRKDIHYKNVIEHYRQNLEKMKNLVSKQAQPIKLFFVDLPVNYYQIPTLSIHNPKLDGHEIAKIKKLIEQAMDYNKKRDTLKAEEIYSEAVKIDPIFAESYFERGLCRLKNGRIKQSWFDVINALQLDMNPGRPTLEIKETILNAASDHKSITIKIDSPALSSMDSKYYQKFFHDSCHLTKMGYDLVGKQISVALLNSFR